MRARDKFGPRPTEIGGHLFAECDHIRIYQFLPNSAKSHGSPQHLAEIDQFGLMLTKVGPISTELGRSFSKLRRSAELEQFCGQRDHAWPESKKPGAFSKFGHIRPIWLAHRTF